MKKKKTTTTDEKAEEVKFVLNTVTLLYCMAFRVHVILYELKVIDSIMSSVEIYD